MIQSNFSNQSLFTWFKNFLLRNPNSYHCDHRCAKNVHWTTANTR